MQFLYFCKQIQCPGFTFVRFVPCFCMALCAFQCILRSFWLNCCGVVLVAVVFVLVMVILFCFWLWRLSFAREFSSFWFYSFWLLILGFRAGLRPATIPKQFREFTMILAVAQPKRPLSRANRGRIPLGCSPLAIN